MEMARTGASSTASCSSVPSLQSPSSNLETHDYTETNMPLQGKFGLWYHRSTNWRPVRFADSSESDESFRQREHNAEVKKTADRRLNKLNQEIREEIDTRLWATMYLQYLVKRINVTTRVNIEFTDLPNIGNLSLKDDVPAPSPEEQLRPPFQDLSVDVQLQILERRLEDARIGAEAIWATLNELTVKLSPETSEYPLDNYIAFRIFHRESQARLFPSGDIRCGNWQEFNVNEGLTRAGAEKHIAKFRDPTDYISLTTSPRRLWNLVDKWGRIDQEIVVIDLRVCERLGIAYGSTTDDLGFHNSGPNRTEYATKYHILVVGWIPRCGVLGFLSTGTFEELLEKAQIDTSGKGDEIPSTEYDKKIPFHLVQGAYTPLSRLCPRVK